MNRAMAFDAQPAQGSVAFERLMKAHYRSLYLYACRLTGDPSNAEDITQETFLRAYRAFDAYDTSRPFRPWLYRIAKNLFIDMQRGRKQSPAASLDALMEVDSGESQVTLQIADPNYDPHRILMEATLDETLERALTRLPYEFYAAIALCDLGGMTYEEVAEALQCTVGTVRSRIHRGRKMMRENLREMDLGTMSRFSAPLVASLSAPNH